MLKLLIVEDTPQVRARLVDVFTRDLSGYEVLTADNRDDGIGLLAIEEPDLVLLDLVIPPDRRATEGTWENGREVLRWIRKARPQTRVIVLSSMGHLTRDFLKEEDADDFFTKDSAADWAQEKLVTQVEALLGHVVCRSPGMRALREQLADLHEDDLVVVIEGEAGAGKEYLARTIHWNSPHARKQFIPLPVTAMRPATLLPSVVGERGEFTSHGLLGAPDTGTLFFEGLQHLGMVDSLVQGQLAALLEGVEGGELSYRPLGSMEAASSRCRLVFSTTVPVAELASRGTVSPELHAQLRKAKTFAVPSLSQRQEDVEELLHCFRRAANRGRDGFVVAIAPGVAGGVCGRIADGSMGNVGELASALTVAMDACEGEILCEGDLPVQTSSAAQPTEPQALHERTLSAYRQAESAYLQTEDAGEKLRHLERLSTLGQMVAGIAHEVKNPLTAVLGIASTMRRVEMSSEEVSDFAQTIVDEARRIGDLVDEVRQFGKAEQHAPRQACDLADTAEEALQLMQFDGNFRRAQVVRELSANPMVPIARDRLKQVLLNLLKNGAESLKGDEKRLTITTAQTDEEATVAIRDSGCGIAPEDLDRIWQPFYTTKGEQGTGLGLDICRKIVESHGGGITAESQIGEGTTLTIRLPRVRASESAGAGESDGREA